MKIRNAQVFFVLFLLVIAFRVITFKHDYPQNITVRIKGRVVQDTVIYENKRQVVVNGVKAYIDLYPEVVYGDTIVLEGEIKDEVLQSPKLVKVEEGGGLYYIRERILNVFEEALPDPHTALLSGIVLGSKSNMPQDFWEKLKTTGTAHVVVASGMNVTFITSFLVNFLIGFIKRRKAIFIALSGAWIYVLLSGFDPPLVRAAIMGSIAFSAQSVGRISQTLRTLFISAGLMLFIKPEWFSDLGFILSFMATLSLVVFESKIYRLISKIPVIANIKSLEILRKDLSTTIAAQIGVTPILLVSFGSVNIFSPFINALVLWTIPPIMIVGAIAAIVGLLIPSFGQVISLLILPFSYWFISVIELFS